MKKYRCLLYLLLFLVILCTNVDVYAHKCNDFSNLCDKKTYGFSKDGSTKDFSITIGVIHFNQISGNSTSTEEYIVSMDDCGACNNDSSPCAKYCSIAAYRFDTSTNDVSISVNSDSKVFPIAICAIPYNNSSPLNQPLTDVNARDYVYFNETEISNAISNGKCTQENIFYSSNSANSSNGGSGTTTGNTYANCENKESIDYFSPKTNMTDANISTKSYSVGNQNVCSVTIVKNGEEVVYNYYTPKDSGFACMASSFATSCRYATNNHYTCTLYTCSNNLNGTTSDNGVGKTCLLRNIDNSNDTITLSYTFAKTITSSGGSYFNSIRKGDINGEIATDPVQIGSEEYVLTKSCPSYVYYIKSSESDTGYKYVVLSSNELKDLYDEENSNDLVVKKYRFENVSDQGILTEENVVNFKGDIDWGDPVEVNCEGIIGQEMLDFLNKIFRWIQIIAPIFVIIMGVVEFGKSVLLDDKEALKKASSKFIMRLIIAVALFFIPLILGWILEIFNGITGAATSTCGIGE